MLLDGYRALDQGLVNALDRVTGCAQKRWGARLTRIIVASAIGNVVCYGYNAVTTPDYVGLFFTALWMIDVAYRVGWARTNDDYPENWRKAAALNAKAVFHRTDTTSFVIRVVFAQFWLTVIIAQVLGFYFYAAPPLGVGLNLSGLFIACNMYLTCCTYLAFTPRQRHVWVGKNRNQWSLTHALSRLCVLATGLFRTWRRRSGNYSKAVPRD